jgi:serine phosphatase RsbU (regulator of sigma subunit)
LDVLPTGLRVSACRLDGTHRIVLIGRQESCDWVIADPSISRQHAELRASGRDWLVTDKGSRHGTTLNGVPLKPGQSLPIRPGDELGLGSWRCRCVGGEAVSSTFTVAGGESGARWSAAMLDGLAQSRLQTVLGAARAMASAGSRDEIARELLRAVGTLGGAARAVVVRPTGDDEYEFLGVPEPLSGEEAGIELSRSLLRAAATGQAVQLDGAQTPEDWSRSVMQLHIRTALCAPVMVQGRPDCFLYIDTRAGERALESGAPAFAVALADVAAMAIQRVLTAEMDARRREIERDLEAAREAQIMLMPNTSGALAGLRYVFESIPGRSVAGDLFDVVALSDDRAGFYLGDVAGKGVGAGVVMAAAQGQLRTLLTRGEPLAETLNATGETLARRLGGRRFLTLLAGVWDRQGRTLELCDAGHGLCVLLAPGVGVELITVEGGLPLGAVTGASYTTTTLRPVPGSALVIFSDGAIEQLDARGGAMGVRGVLELLEPGMPAATIVRTLVDAVLGHGGGVLGDDLTVAAVEFE